jgi:hypothetical protein
LYNFYEKTICDPVQVIGSEKWVVVVRWGAFKGLLRGG